jgi:hypothetical protein
MQRIVLYLNASEENKSAIQVQQVCIACEMQCCNSNACETSEPWIFRREWKHLKADETCRIQDHLEQTSDWWLHANQQATVTRDSAGRWSRTSTGRGAFQASRVKGRVKFFFNSLAAYESTRIPTPSTYLCAMCKLNPALRSLVCLSRSWGCRNLEKIIKNGPRKSLPKGFEHGTSYRGPDATEVLVTANWSQARSQGTRQVGDKPRRHGRAGDTKAVPDPLTCLLALPLPTQRRRPHVWPRHRLQPPAWRLRFRRQPFRYAPASLYPSAPASTLTDLRTKRPSLRAYSAL